VAKRKVPKKKSGEGRTARTKAKRAAGARSSEVPAGAPGDEPAEEGAAPRADEAVAGLPPELELIDDVEAIDIDLTSLTSAEGAPVSARRAERVLLEDRVELRGFFEDGAREDRIRDASLHGVFVETARVLEVGDPVVLAFTLDDGKRLRVSGRVRWVTPFGGLRDARPGMGIELVGVAAAARDLLGAHLSRRRRAQLLTSPNGNR
jgi:hypothetical protein